MLRRALIAAAALAVIAVGAGCALGPPGTGDVTLRVTENFGARAVRTVTTARFPGSETVLGLLRRSFTVTTAPGGGSVTSIGGASAGTWSLYVNGSQVKQGLASTAVHHDDVVWWDLHDARATDSIPAVVGAYPEPFEHGIGGKRYPTTIECGSGVGAACRRVTAALDAIHVPVASQLLGTGSGPDTLGVVVGTWPQISSEVASQLIVEGPGASGVYARFTGHDGDSLALLDPAGHLARTLGAGAGLIAATADTSSVPSWLITGTDAAGVDAAARALTPQALRDHFALAVQGDTQIPLPVAP